MEVSLHLQICKILWHLFFPKSRHHVEGTEEFATASILRIAVISEYLGCHNFSVEGRCQKTIFSEFRLLPKLHPSRISCVLGLHLILVFFIGSYSLIVFLSTLLRNYTGYGFICLEL